MSTTNWSTWWGLIWKKLWCGIVGHKWYQIDDPSNPLGRQYKYHWMCERCLKFR